MSASLAISSAALAQSSAAMSRARAAECKAFMPSYDPATATPEVMRLYAECVNRLYPVTPSAMSTNELLFLKTAIVLGLIGLVAGAIKGWNSDEHDLAHKTIMAVLTALMFGLGIPFVLGIGAAAVALVGWVIS